MGWEVCLAGDAADLGMLAGSFTGPDFAISKSGDEFLLTSPEFEALNAADKIRDRAVVFIELLNGAARLALESRTPVAIVGVNRRHPNGGRDVVVFAEPGVFHCRLLAPSLTVTHLDGSTETYHPADPIRDWINLASTDNAVKTTLKLLSSGVWDWVNLYRVLDVVTSDCEGLEKIEANGWATTTAMRLFKHTSGSPGAVGKEARHGAESTMPPPKPMSLPEAKSLVLGIVQSWLCAKVTAP